MTYQQQARIGEKAHTPVEGQIDWEYDEVQIEKIETLGPSSHKRVSRLVVLAGYLSQLAVEETAEGMHPGSLGLIQPVDHVFNLQINQIIVQILAGLQSSQVSSVDCDGVLPNSITEVKT